MKAIGTLISSSAALLILAGCDKPQAISTSSDQFSTLEKRIEALESQVADLKKPTVTAKPQAQPPAQKPAIQGPPSEAQARAAFIKDKGDDYPYSGLKAHITSVQFGERQEFQGRVIFPAKVIFQPPGSGPSHARVEFMMGPFGEWECM